MPDTYANKAYIAVTESAAGTLTFQELATGLSTFDKVGWVINRIEYFLSNATLQELAGVADTLVMGVVLSNKLTSIDLSDAAVVDAMKFDPHPFGVPANCELEISPYRIDFEGMPGGGLLVPPRPLYLGVQSGGFVAAAAISCRIYYIQKELKTEEYWELVESVRMVQ